MESGREEPEGINLMFPVFKITPDKDETHAGSIHVFRMNTDKIYITVVLCLKKKLKLIACENVPISKILPPPLFQVKDLTDDLVFVFIL